MDFIGFLYLLSLTQTTRETGAKIMCFVATVLPTTQLVFALLVVFLFAKIRKHRYTDDLVVTMTNNYS